MSSRKRSTRIVSFAAGLLVWGIASLQAARAQDADPNAPPPGASQVPPGGAPPAVERSGAAPYKPFVLMPFVGIQSIQNDNSGTGPGLRIGGLVGARINEQFSFNGELLFDLENFNNVPANASENDRTTDSSPAVSVTRLATSVNYRKAAMTRGRGQPPTSRPER